LKRVVKISIFFNKRFIMKANRFLFLFTASISFAMVSIFSCTSADIEDLPPNTEVSSSSLSSSSSESQEPGQFEGTNVFVDARDGNRYKYEIYNSRIWMSENLNYSRGGTIGYCYRTNSSTTDIAEAINRLGTVGADDPGCTSPYGRHYTWQVAMDENSLQGLCPNNWHIPNAAEWDGISNKYDYSKKMSSSFYVYAGNFNLNAEWPPFGWKNRGTEGFYWSSTNTAATRASTPSTPTGGIRSFYMGNGSASYEKDNVLSDNYASSNMDYFSIRCILDTGFMADCNGQDYNPVTGICLEGIVIPRAGW
jgi:uncharacterized protein (TIGR02145 family)